MDTVLRLKHIQQKTVKGGFPAAKLVSAYHDFCTCLKYGDLGNQRIKQEQSDYAWMIYTGMEYQNIYKMHTSLFIYSFILVVVLFYVLLEKMKGQFGRGE